MKGKSKNFGVDPISNPVERERMRLNEKGHREKRTVVQGRV